MSEIPMGTIDPEKLGCSNRACIIFTEHAKGKPIPRIARELSLTEDTVRAEIAGVWHDDKKSAHHSRKAAREVIE